MAQGQNQTEFWLELRGVNPSPQMFDHASAETQEFANRITLQEGSIEDATERPFNGATCLLTLYFLSRKSMVYNEGHLSAVHPSAPSVVDHHSFANYDAGKDNGPTRFASSAAKSELGDA